MEDITKSDDMLPRPKSTLLVQTKLSNPPITEIKKTLTQAFSPLKKSKFKYTKKIKEHEQVTEKSSSSNSLAYLSKPSNNIIINNISIESSKRKSLLSLKSEDSSLVIDLDGFFENADSVKEYSFKEFQNPSFRQEMEDFTILMDKFNGNPLCGLFGVLDGHGGSQAVKMVFNKFAEVISTQLSNWVNSSVNESLLNAFIEMDECLKNNLKEADKQGTTATIVYICQENGKKYAYCANVGDSTCYALYNESVAKISRDHRCSDKDEVIRVKENGGLICQKRVMGSLMITRSIGDLEYREFGVSCIPDIKKIEITDDLRYLVIASDGVWDFVTQDMLQTLSILNEKTDEFTNAIVNSAINKKSRDNISCIVLKFNN